MHANWALVPAASPAAYPSTGGWLPSHQAGLFALHAAGTGSACSLVVQLIHQSKHTGLVQRHLQSTINIL